MCLRSPGGAPVKCFSVFSRCLLEPQALHYNSDGRFTFLGLSAGSVNLRGYYSEGRFTCFTRYLFGFISPRDNKVEGSLLYSFPFRFYIPVSLREV